MSSDGDSTEGGSLQESSDFEVNAGEARRFFELSLDLFCIADLHEERFLRVNPAFEDVLGYSADTLTSRPILEFVHPEDREKTSRAFEHMTEGEENLEQFVNRYHCRDGSIVWLEWRARSYQSGSVSYATARNITDRKQAEREREQFKQQFEQAQKLESVGVLAGGIAHDFNNLLMTILANTGLIESKLEAEHPAREWVGAIADAAHRGAELCDQLLAYAGEGQFEVSESELSSIVRNTDHLLETAVSEAIELQYHLEPHLPLAQLDTTQVQQILINVVQNASEAIVEAESGDELIRISTGVRTWDREALADTYLDDELEPGEYVYLKIEDEGIGMGDEEMERLFDPFYTTKSTGRGLGLSATLGIVRAHRGALEVDSQLGGGTTFTFYFPTVETHRPFAPSNRQSEFEENSGLDEISDDVIEGLS